LAIFEAAGVSYFNDGTGKKYQPMRFGDGKGAIYGRRQPILMATDGPTSWWRDPTRPAL
jgi:hypothetical protein